MREPDLESDNAARAPAAVRLRRGFDVGPTGPGRNLTVLWNRDRLTERLEQQVRARAGRSSVTVLWRPTLAPAGAGPSWCSSTVSCVRAVMIVAPHCIGARNGARTIFAARRDPCVEATYSVTLVTMFASWDGWQLPHIGRISTVAYLVGAIIALLLGAGIWSALIGSVVAFAVICPLEGWFRYRNEPLVRDDLSKYPRSPRAPPHRVP